MIYNKVESSSTEVSCPMQVRIEVLLRMTTIPKKKKKGRTCYLLTAKLSHPAGTSVISASFEGFRMVVCEKIYFEVYTNDQYI